MVIHALKIRIPQKTFITRDTSPNYSQLIQGPSHMSVHQLGLLMPGLGFAFSDVGPTPRAWVFLSSPKSRSKSPRLRRSCCCSLWSSKQKRTTGGRRGIASVTSQKVFQNLPRGDGFRKIGSRMGRNERNHMVLGVSSLEFGPVECIILLFASHGVTGKM